MSSEAQVGKGDTSISDLQLPRLQTMHFWCLNHLVWGTFYGSPRKLIQWVPNKWEVNCLSSFWTPTQFSVYVHASPQRRQRNPQRVCVRFIWVCSGQHSAGDV